MTLRVTPATEAIVIDNMVITVYSPPGIGKTSLGSTATGSLLIDFDRGVHRSKFRGDSVQLQTWSELRDMTEEDLADYQTIVIDTAGRCVDLLAVDIIASDPKLGQKDGALTIKGWQALKSRFTSWVKLIRSYKKDLVLLAHDREDKKGDNVIVRPDISGGSYGEIFKASDAVAYLCLKNGRRTLDFNPNEDWVAKNPAGMPPITIPDFAGAPGFLGGVITEIKRSMGRLSEESQAVAVEVEVWRVRIDLIADGDDLNALLEWLTAPIPSTTLAGMKRPVLLQAKRLLNQRAQVLGFVYVRTGDGGCFVTPPASAPAAVAPDDGPPLSKAAQPPADGPPVAKDAPAPDPELAPAPESPAAVPADEWLVAGQEVEFTHSSGDRMAGTVSSVDWENGSALILPDGRSRSTRVALNRNAIIILPDDPGERD